MTTENLFTGPHSIQIDHVFLCEACEEHRIQPNEQYWVILGLRCCRDCIEAARAFIQGIGGGEWIRLKRTDEKVKQPPIDGEE